MTEQVAHIRWLGWVVFTIVVGSMFFVLVATIAGRPYKPKVTLIVVGTLLGLLVAILAGLWVGGLFFSVLMG